MNKCFFMGRLTRDPEVRQSNTTTVSRFSLAVDRRYKKDGEPTADFINCVAFGKTAEFIEKYIRKGVKIAIEGRLQTGSYTNKEGAKVYTTDIVVEAVEFAESKQTSEAKQETNDVPHIADGWVNLGNTDFEELPFN